MGNELVATYYFGAKSIDIYGCWDGEGEDFDFFDLYVNGECVNEGDPLEDFPTRDDARRYLG